ncbi:MAG: prephenate dehydrogenase/arogenate dehydrogenase family protein, partial [Candidatus Diapherotrites archaeon]|nr:prephenate dehydrogenase/arogenate dehydrogenase family protein [Candidatus Diapherotrites archaeon]
IFRNEKAKIITSTANEHDQMTAIIQGLTHMIFIASACTFQEMSLDIERLKEFSTPVFEVFLSIMARVVIQNPEMYANIQSQNTHNSKTRELFIKNMGFLGKLADSKDTTNLKTNIASSAQSFKYPEEFLFESDKALAAINAEKQELSRLIGHKVALQNICSGKYHYGIVKEMDFDNIILEHNKTQTPMKIRNIRLLGKMEYTNWLNENVEKNYRDYSILVYEKCKPKIISNILEFAESIDSVKLIDEYNGPQIKKGKKSLTFRLGFFEDINSKKIDQSVKKTISGLGFSLR